MKDVAFAGSLVLIIIPILLVIYGIDTRVENKLDSGIKAVFNDWTITLGIWALNLGILVGLIPLALGRYGLGILG